METAELREWLENGGAEGLSWLQLEDFPNTGRGVKTLRPLKSDDVVLTIPGSFLWTVDAAFDDPILGPTISSVKPPLQLLNNLFSKHPDLFPLEKFTQNDYMWALCTIWSRGMDFQLPGKQFRCIAPFADMLNHSPDVQLCHIYNPQSDSLQILAGKDYTIGEQVFINYGSVPNNRLLRLYGFVLPNNPYDTYDLVLTTHPLAPLYAQKVTLLESAGLQVNATFPLTLSDPLPLDVLRYLRIQRLSSSEISTVEAKRGARNIVSARNEAEILKALIEACVSLLDGFSVPLEKLEENIASGVYQESDNRWAAAHVSIGEQRILKMTLQKTREFYALVICAQCGKANENNKRCGRCRRVVYCGTDCQKSNYKEHKVICRTYTTD